VRVALGAVRERRSAKKCPREITICGLRRVSPGVTRTRPRGSGQNRGSTCSRPIQTCARLLHPPTNSLPGTCSSFSS
jgi:hypothetical protein